MKRDIMVIRESIARIVSMLTNQAIQVTMRGTRAYVAYHPTTGKILSVNIPYIPDDASDEFISAIQGFLDHEVGHVLYSDFDALQKATAAGARVANLANIIEDVFVERKMTEGFRGSGTNLESVRKFYLEKIARVKINAALAAGNTEEARGYATVAAFRAWGGQAVAADFIKEPKIAALVAPVAAKLGADTIAAIAKCNNSDECLALARICKDKLETVKPPAPPPPPPPPDDLLEAMKKAGSLADALTPEEKEEEPDEGESEEVEPGKTTVMDDDSGKKREDDEKIDEVDGPVESDTAAPPSSEPPAEEGEPESSEEPAGMGTEGEGEGEEGSGSSGEGDSDGTPSEDPSDSEGTGSGALDPLADMLDTERDFDKDMGDRLSADAKKEIKSSDYAVFSAEWDQIIPAPLSTRPDSASKMEDSVRDKIGVMQKSLERAMAAQARKSWNPGMRRGRIAPGSLFKVSVGDDRVFRQRFETRAKNTAVSLVVDCSGSMNGEKIELAGLASFALATVMERLKLTYEVIGFTTGYSGEMMEMMDADAKSSPPGTPRISWGRVEPLYMPVFKSFGGKLDTSARSRIAHLTERPGWLNQNVDGECVQIAARRLVQQPAERHIMIVLSDGVPSAVAAKNLAPHLKKTVKEISAQGVEVIGIGIQTTAVKQFYPKHVVLNDAAELPTRVMAELTKLLMAP